MTEASSTVTGKRVYFYLGIIILAGLFLRIFYLLEYIDSPDYGAPAVDAAYHDYWARGLVTGKWTVPDSAVDPQVYRHPFYRPPGYPYFLALVYLVFGTGALAPRIVQMLLGLSAAVLAYYLGRQWWGRAVGMVFFISDGGLLDLYLL